MTICGRLNAFFFSFFLILATAMPALAQSTEVPDNGGWRVVLRQGVTQYYSSPGGACSKQYEEYGFPGTSYRGFRATSQPTSKKCDWTNQVDETGPFTILPATVIFVCPLGKRKLTHGTPRCEPTPQPVCDPCDATKAGNPITIEQGGKYERVVDYASADGRFNITRFYNSRAYGDTVEFGNTDLNFGPNWQFGSLPELWMGSRLRSSAEISAVLPTGQSYNAGRLSADGLSWDTEPVLSGTDGRNSKFKLSSLGDPITDQFGYLEQPGLYLFTDKKGVEYTMQTVASGTLFRRGIPVSALWPGGYEQIFTYTEDNRIEMISDNLGRTASFEWKSFDLLELDANGVPAIHQTNEGPIPTKYLGIERITINDGTILEYDYDLADQGAVPGGPFLTEGYEDRLVGFKRFAPDGGEVDSATYHYEDERHLYNLTGITDDAGIRYSTWAYDEDGRAISSTQPGDVNKTEVSYEDMDNQLFRTVTNALGREMTYTFDRVNTSTSARVRLTEIDGASTLSVLADTQIKEYADYKNPPVRSIDKEGRIKDITYDHLDRIVEETYAVGTADEFTNNYVWHERFMDLPKTITMPGMIIDNEYDDQGRMITSTLFERSLDPIPDRIWAYDYDGPNPISIDGPLPGAGDTITMSWVEDRLTSVTNEVGHVTQITGHAGNGAPRVIIDPNNVTTTLTYDGKYRLTGIERAGAVTNISYTPTDLVTNITLPNQSSLSFFYDDARRLRAIRNAEGEEIQYERNALGGIVTTTVTNGTDLVDYQMNAAFDEINRVISATGVNSLTKFNYDKEDNLTNITDPRNNNWTQTFDNLDRLKSELNPLGGTVDYQMDSQMDARNPLTAVTDERNVTTIYERNGFGEVIAEISAERGTTTYERDSAGRITRMTDARGIISDYVYDNADRLLSVTYADNPQDNITYGYDQGSFGIGELTSTTEAFGTTTYGYDALGHMVAMSRVINGVSYDCTYEYDLAGEVTAMVYPSGTRIEYTRDNAARITSITMTATDGTVTALATGIDYKSFGPVETMTSGDGHVLSVDYDLNYRATNLRRAKDGLYLINMGFTYDPASDITAINDTARPERSQTFGYDALSRLTSADGAYGSIDYGYNAGGDRTFRDWSQTDGSLRSEQYTYEAATARLLGVTLDDGAGNVSPLRDFSYNASGQVTGDDRADMDGMNNVYSYGINARGRMNSVTRDGAAVADYTYDESEQRIIKSADGTTTHYHYDLEGRLIAETDGTTGETIREYVWLGLMPVAVIEAGSGSDCSEEIAQLEADIADRNMRIDNNAARIIELGDLIIDKNGRIESNAARITELGDLIIDKDTRIASNAARITELGDLILDKQTRIASNAARISELEGLILDKQNRIANLNPETRADRIAELEALIIGHQTRIDELTIRNGELAALITGHETRIDELTVRNAELAVLVTGHETRIDELTARNAELVALADGHAVRITELTDRNVVLTTQRDNFQTQLDAILAGGCESASAGGIYYLHADHLGRPQFATDSTGAIVWDMSGDVTPFGEAVNLAGAFAQRLMFPGQYADEETGEQIVLSHNWHRTYDPTLGRYLQSDPIGLAGGFNRYVYGLANPVSNIDPDGLLTDVHLALADFVENFMLMRRIKKEVGWIEGTDKWVHCLANCNATKRTKIYGRCGATTISYVREAFDFPKNIFWRGMTLDRTVADFRADNEANVHGRSAPSSPGFVNCRASCSRFRPAALPKRY